MRYFLIGLIGFLAFSVLYRSIGIEADWPPAISAIVFGLVIIAVEYFVIEDN